jgi:hypothetical protein
MRPTKCIYLFSVILARNSYFLIQQALNDSFFNGNMPCSLWNTKQMFRYGIDYLSVRCFGSLYFRQSSVREAAICRGYLICVCMCVCVCVYVHGGWRISCVFITASILRNELYALCVKDENMSENHKTVQGKKVKLNEAWNQCIILIVLQLLFVLRDRKLGFFVECGRPCGVPCTTLHYIRTRYASNVNLSDC